MIHCGMMPVRIIGKSLGIVLLSAVLFYFGGNWATKSACVVVGAWAFFLFFLASLVPKHLYKFMFFNMLILAVVVIAVNAKVDSWPGVGRATVLIVLTQLGSARERGHQSHRFLMALFFLLLAVIAGVALFAALSPPGATFSAGALPKGPVLSEPFVFPLYGEPNKSYPFCGFSWPMAKNDTMSSTCNDTRLALVDFAQMSSACYELVDKEENETKVELNRTFPGWQLIKRVRQLDFKDISFIHIKRGNTHVIAVRGTQTLYDVLQDFNIFMPTVALQLAGDVGPHVADMSRILEVVTAFADWSGVIGPGRRARADARNLDSLYDYVAEMKNGSEHGSVFYLVGHSLGGGYALAVGALQNVTAVTFSAPGLGSTSVILSPKPNPSALRQTGINVVPANDPVPQVDQQVGAVLKIDCGAGFLGCHSLTSTMCELSAVCGDAGGRPFARNYKFPCAACEKTGQHQCSESPRQVVA